MHIRELTKKALLVGAFFVPVFFLPGFLAHAECPAGQNLQWQRVAKVVDGDTLKLADGRSVRLIGVNAPELAGKGRSAEPLAEQAKRALQALVHSSGSEVGLQLGDDAHDHYGRTLAHAFGRDGQNWEAQLIAQGLAWQVAIAPNTRLAACQLRAEQAAQRAMFGVWRATLSAHVQRSGFQPLAARIVAVQRNRGGIWLELEHGAVARIAWRHSKQAWPSDTQLQQGRWLIKGWWRDRAREQGSTQRARWLVDLQHPSMLREWR
ncbi:thermonuclease family protein [Atopomonas sediminilitoris]|uniref:thermonuclease family protein n=1 Tax=Atopomonas sediminilitoris TaxID=2919919 RepID=UPI001F4ED63A|nr:thermonuclease family protein [Atopomonas sediminilitoris]MCJ8170400.1 thermonuclease family protein [Atopomonas sediminilitoris]